jgi:AraC family transcriptional activator of pobA
MVRQQPAFHEALRAHLMLLLVEVMRIAATTDQTACREQPLLARVFDFIEGQYRTPISLTDVARAVHLSPGHLTSLVHRLTGRTVLEWIIERRLTEARRLLLETDHSIERVGQLVSYTDAAYFIRQFRRAHGMTPAAWRRVRRSDAHPADQSGGTPDLPHGAVG